MKKTFTISALLIIIVLSVTSCAPSPEETAKITYKYEVGDVLAFKIDTSVCIITERRYDSWDEEIVYTVRYRGNDNEYDIAYVTELEIFKPPIMKETSTELMNIENEFDL